MVEKKIKAVRTKNQSFSNKMDATVVALNIEDILVNFVPIYEDNIKNVNKTLKKVTDILKDEDTDPDLQTDEAKIEEKQEKQEEQKSFLNIIGKNISSSLKTFKDFSLKALSKGWRMATDFIAQQYKNLQILVEHGFKMLTGMLDEGLKTAQETLPLLLSWIPFGAIIGKIVGGVLFGIPRILLKVIPKIITGLFNIGGIIGKSLFIDLPKKIGGIVTDSLTTPSGLLMWGLIIGFIFRKHLVQLFRTYIKPLWDDYVQPYVDKIWGSIKDWFGKEENIKWLRSFFPKAMLDFYDSMKAWWNDPATQSWWVSIKEFMKNPIDTFNKWWSGDKGAEKTLFSKIGTAISNLWNSPETLTWRNEMSKYIWDNLYPELVKYTNLAIDLIWETLNPWSTTKKFNKDVSSARDLIEKGNKIDAYKILNNAITDMAKSNMSDVLKDTLTRQAESLYGDEKTAIAELKKLRADNLDKQKNKKYEYSWGEAFARQGSAGMTGGPNTITQYTRDTQDARKDEEYKKVDTKLQKMIEKLEVIEQKTKGTQTQYFNNVNVAPPPRIPTIINYDPSPYSRFKLVTP